LKRDIFDGFSKINEKERFLLFSSMDLDFNYKMERPEPADINL